ncbi:MAG TPA: hypothetical protein DDX39_09040 [Bacteroidales bacterium]|nr:MAG: hypothetical protein A2W98_06155 [Bacteroidetes bacterium GWF2_33_38]OFY74328.1 MAG: hypothetical protein A2265_09645 [Bacteroidetes bacterium RIFOXYA12_FULL_33_9]HBF88773.1 hypothetical protein [Bacteroidales bacterium]
MQKLFILYLLVFLSFFVKGQVSITTGGNVSTCNNTFIAGNVLSGQTYEMTICADESGDSHISILFSEWDVSGSNLLCVYDGPNSTYQLIGCYDNTNWGPTKAFTSTAANLSGCLTFVLTSADGAASWNGGISCNFSCQPFYSELLSSTPSANQEYINICKGESVTFNGSGDYYVNDTLYHQENSTSTFLWNFGDGTASSGETVNHTFNEPGGYGINLIITDQYGCVNSNYLGNRVRVSTKPDFVGTSASNSTSCYGETVDLNGIVNPTKWTYEAVTTVAGETYLPDGGGESYSTSIVFDVFDAGQTLDDINDLEGICANMEHSYLEDLVISIVCPNGTQVVLEDQGGGGTNLGEPVDIADPEMPGVGYAYCWSPSPSYGVMSVEALSHSTLPPGSYASFQTLEDLLGCPLNGLWTINITDNWQEDDGFIFSWGINFATEIYPPLWNFTPTFQVSDMSWVGDGVSEQGDASITITPDDYGTHYYTFSATDNYGCTYDTTISITVLEDNHPDCCDLPAPEAGQNSTVYGNSYHLQATPIDSVTSYTWTVEGPGYVNFSNADSSGTTATINQYGLYNFIFTQELDGCTSNDQVQILFLEIPDTVKPLNVNIPNTFTPNGDEINDTWIIDGIEDEENVKVFVYNRYGTRLFHSEGYYTPWDGKYNGSVLPTASYYYVIRIRDENDFNGIINIVGPK